MSDGATGGRASSAGHGRRGLLQGQGPCQGLRELAQHKGLRAALRCREGCGHLSGLEGDRPVPLHPDSHGHAATSNEGLWGRATYG